jgi:hypothetical protein
MVARRSYATRAVAVASNEIRHRVKRCRQLSAGSCRTIPLARCDGDRSSVWRTARPPTAARNIASFASYVSRTPSTSARTPPGQGTVARMPPNAHTAIADRVVERCRAVALAHHFREAEGLSIAQIASRLGRSPATIKSYFYDPTGDKARAVKARYHGVCRGCGAYTQPRNGKGDAYAYCKACHPGAIERRWTPDRVVDAMRAWRAMYGRLPSSYDWSITHARRRSGQALQRVAEREWPPASVVTDVFGGWRAARAAAESRRLSVTRCPGGAGTAAEERFGSGPTASGGDRPRIHEPPCLRARMGEDQPPQRCTSST